MIIEVDALAKQFGEIEAVKGVTFGVEPGEIFGFLGPNGAGKTTTINMLCTLLTPTSGSAIVNGFDVRHDRSEVRRSIGLVFQQTTLDEYLSAEQNLRFHAYAYGLSAELRERRMTELLDIVDLADRRKGSVRTYSGGMKRRLEIARGLLHHPKVLFLDEPTLGLDPQTRRLIWDYLLKLRETEGLTIFLTTHYMDEAEQLCDRLVVMDHAKIVAEGSPRELIEQYSTREVLELRLTDANRGSLDGRLDDLAERVEELPDRILLYAEDGEQALEQVHARQIPIESALVRRSTLEDVFLRLTGRTLIE